MPVFRRSVSLYIVLDVLRLMKEEYKDIRMFWCVDRNDSVLKWIISVSFDP